MRIFIAIDIPDKVKDEIFDFVELLKKSKESGIKYVTKENLHLTLKFLGEIDEVSLKNISENISKIDFFPFTLKLNGIGCFPNFFNPRVLWIGIKDGKNELLSLYKRIDSVVPKNLGVENDHNFSPHLTIARFKLKPSSEFITFLKSKDSVEFKEFLVNSFVIYESILKPSGPVYKKVSEFFCG